MKQQNKRRGLLAGVGALVTAFALAIGGGVAANAAPQPVPEEADVTITKLSQPATPGDAATGEEVTTLPDGAEPIGGVIFDYYLVTDTGIGGAKDIGTNAGQQHAAGLTASTALIPGSATGDFPATNSTTGVTTKELPRGLYVVKERASSVPDGVVAAADFLLAVPMTDPTNLNDWLDHIWVYPKNMKVTATKTVAEGSVLATGVANTFDWTIISDVPRVIGADGLTKQAESVQITDTLDSRLSLDSANGVLVEIIDETGDAIAGNDQLVAADYTVTGNVVVTFEDDGLTKLFTAAGNNGYKIKTTIKTYVNDATLDAIDGTAIKNQATILINEGETDELTVTSSEAQTNWGLVSFTKKDNATPTANNLPGAKFELRATADGAPLVAAQTSAVTTGLVSFNGVRASDHEDGALISDVADYQVYYIVETEAPSGYQLLAEPVPVLLMSDGKIYTFTADASGKPQVGTSADPHEVLGAAELTDINNVANEGGFTLPITGGIGTAFLTVIGIAIVGSVLLIVRRRRGSDEEAAV